jgi:nucleolar protein 15
MLTGDSIATEDAAPTAIKKSKTPKSTNEDTPKSKTAKKVSTNKPEENHGVVGILKNGTDTVNDSEVNDAAEARSKKVKEPKVTNEATSSSDEEVEDEIDDESEIDDQTEALLKGFESDGDDEDTSKEGGLKPGQKIPKVPDMNNKSRKQLKRMKESETPDKPGVVYIGRIPHGFYENEMKAYFNQFGTILKLRLSRNRKTGQSKHYAWIKFESATVAEIVAKTMDTYLLFNHILKVKVVPDGQVPENLFKGANKRFKKVPWNKIEGRKLEQGASEETWEKRIGKEEKKRVEKAEKLKKIGYEFEAPKIKSAKNVAKKPDEKELTANGEGEIITKAIQAVPISEDSMKPKKKKEKNVKPNKIFGIDVPETAQILAAKEKKEAEKAKKKEMKAKAIEEANVAEKTAPASAEEPSKPEEKKRKADEEGNEKSGDKKKKHKKDKKAKASA